MKKILVLLVGLVTLVGLAFSVSSCSEKSNEWDPYYSWKSRNALWFEQVVDSARTAIAEAKALYGEDWEAHCSWRMFKSLQRSADLPGATTDSIVCKIITKGNGTQEVNYTDYVQIHFRGWLMPSEYIMSDGVTKETKSVVFDQSYYGEFNPKTAAPVTMYVGGTIEGFQTALQNMVVGDMWYVYVPQQLAYKSESNGTVPAYSTLRFLMNLVGVYEDVEDVPAWK